MILLGVRLWLLLREEPSSTSLHSNLCLEELARGWEPGWMHSWHKAFPLSWHPFPSTTPPENDSIYQTFILIAPCRNGEAEWSESPGSVAW